MRLLALLIFLAPTVTLAKKKAPMKPGEWEMSIQVQMSNVPGMTGANAAAMPAFTTRQCLSKKDFIPSAQQEGQDCKVSQQTFKGKHVRWAVSCKNMQGMKISGKGTGEYKDNAFNGTMHMRMEGPQMPQGMEMKYVMSGKRLGPCKKNKRAVEK